MTAKAITLKSVEESLDSWLRPKLVGEPWDNIGLLVGSGLFSKAEKTISRILVCNDLTSKVVAEAINLKVDLIVAYHPPIFKEPLKAVGYNHWKQQVIAKCLAHDIAVYSPHSTMDAAIGGINDRIMKYFRSNVFQNESTVSTIFPPHVDESCPAIEYKSTPANISRLFASVPLNELSNIAVGFDVDDYMANNEKSVAISFHVLKGHDAQVLEKVQDIAKSLGISDLRHPTKASSAVLGAGRILRFNKPVPVEQIIQSLRACTGIPQIKLADGPKSEIESIGLCVGSGITILEGLDVDVLLTGEMKHSEALECIENGHTVILCGHADSERHYLPTLAQILKIVTGCQNVFVSKADQSLFRFV